MLVLDPPRDRVDRRDHPLGPGLALLLPSVVLSPDHQNAQLVPVDAARDLVPVGARQTSGPTGGAGVEPFEALNAVSAMGAEASGRGAHRTCAVWSCGIATAVRTCQIACPQRPTIAQARLSATQKAKARANRATASSDGQTLPATSGGTEAPRKRSPRSSSDFSTAKMAPSTVATMNAPPASPGEPWRSPCTMNTAIVGTIPA